MFVLGAGGVGKSALTIQFVMVCIYIKKKNIFFFSFFSLFLSSSFLSFFSLSFLSLFSLFSLSFLSPKNSNSKLR